MSAHPANWQTTFTEFFHQAVEKYSQGHQKAAGLLDAEGSKFLGSIGYTDQEFFDFVEDFAKGGEPTLQTALSIAAVRRDYFLHDQKGVASTRRISMDDLPAKDAELTGIGWLPRIIQKAEAKLRGEMPAALMYGCGGDRKFFRTNEIDPAEFLEKVRDAKGSSEEIASWVKNKGTLQR